MTGNCSYRKQDLHLICFFLNKKAGFTKYLPAFERSVTEYEIQKGMLNATATDASLNCLCFIRSIVNLKEHLSEPKARQYLDLTDGDELDDEAQSMLAVLQSEKVPKVLTDERCIEGFEVDWRVSHVERSILE